MTQHAHKIYVIFANFSFNQSELQHDGSSGQHSRKFRECASCKLVISFDPICRYCHQVIDADINRLCKDILENLSYFQRRQQSKSAVKVRVVLRSKSSNEGFISHAQAKMRKRLVYGMREVSRCSALGKLKCVIVAPDIEKIASLSLIHI